MTVVKTRYNNKYSSPEKIIAEKKNDEKSFEIRRAVNSVVSRTRADVLRGRRGSEKDRRFGCATTTTLVAVADSPAGGRGPSPPGAAGNTRVDGGSG